MIVLLPHAKIRPNKGAGVRGCGPLSVLTSWVRCWSRTAWQLLVTTWGTKAWPDRNPPNQHTPMLAKLSRCAGASWLYWCLCAKFSAQDVNICAVDLRGGHSNGGLLRAGLGSVYQQDFIIFIGINWSIMGNTAMCWLSIGTYPWRYHKNKKMPLRNHIDHRATTWWSLHRPGDF